MKIFLMLALMFFPWATWAKLSVPNSGIDWKRSTLTIENFETEHESHFDLFKCFRQDAKKLPIKLTFENLGFSGTDSGPITIVQEFETNQCFQTAGKYDLKIRLFDLAGNVTETLVSLVVLPGQLNLDKSEIVPLSTNRYIKPGSFVENISDDCNKALLVANNQDTCRLKLLVKDDFGNIINGDTVTKDIGVNIKNNKWNNTVIEVARNPEQAFLAGLRFENDQTETLLKLNEAGDLNFDIKAAIPSLNVHPKKLGEIRYGQADTFSLPAVFEFFSQDKIDEDTSEKEPPLKSKGVEKKVQLTFEPWVKTMVDMDKETPQLQYIPFRTWTSFPVRFTTFTSSVLPALFNVKFKSIIKEPLSIQFFKEVADEERPEVEEKVLSVQNNESNNYSTELNMRVQGPEHLSVNKPFVLLPSVIYPLLHEGEKKLVEYPTNIVWGESGKDMTFTILGIRADIEGKTSSAKDTSGILLSSSGVYRDAREEITRNAFTMVRGRTPKAVTEFNVNKDFEEDYDVIFIKDQTVKLTGDGEDDSPIVFDQGTKTILIEDGNLLIDRDMVYGGNEDSLGIIMVNKNTNNRVDGNVFVNARVQEFVGTYFLDGSLMSTEKFQTPSVSDDIENRTISNNENPNAPLGLQLVLNGTIISQNTIGGADQSPSMGPWGKPLDRVLALRYDLNYIRRYEPTRDLNNGRIVDDSFNSYCRKVDDKCDPNPYAFVIRPDGRINVLPPPGFLSVPGLSLN